MTSSTLTIARPDDWHLHLRDGEAMQSVIGATARVFARAVVMPNLKPPVTTVVQAAAYRERIAAFFRRPEIRRDDRDAVRHFDHVANAWNAMD